MIWKTGGIGALALAVSGCAIVSPLYDDRMSDAARAACVDIGAVAGEAPAPTCFALYEESSPGRYGAWAGGPLRPGRTLVALRQAGVHPSCGGRFTHLVVTGATDGPGRAELSTWDSLGRPGARRRPSWERAEPVETLVLPTIDGVMMDAAGARMKVIEGRFDPARLCFKSY